MKKIYLPNLEKIIVFSYTLYTQQPTFEFIFNDGINAVIGANGIGKTTFVNLIIYGLVGHKKKTNKQRKNSKKPLFEYSEADFFSARMDKSKSVDDNSKAYVKLDFCLGSNKVSVTRSLSNVDILDLEINDEKIIEPDQENYELIISKFSGITNFRDFEMIIREFLFFDERRENIAWETDKQDDILRILLLDEEYNLKINSLEDLITKADTKGRHESENRRIAQDSYDDLIKEKKEIIDEKNKGDLASNNQNISLTTEALLNQKNEYEIKIKELNLELNTHQENYSRFYNEINEIESNLTNDQLRLDSLETELKRVEVSLYRSIYDDLPDYYYTLEKNLITEGKCMICDSKSNELKMAAIEKKKNNLCLVCSSKLKEIENVDKDIIEKLNKLNVEKDKYSNIVDNKKVEMREKNLELNAERCEIEKLKNMITELKRDIMIIESQLNKADETEHDDMYSEILKKRKELMDELDIKIKKYYEERDNYKEELFNYTRKFQAIINKLNTNLSQYFNKYASTFIGVDCKLSVVNKTINKIPHIIYLPQINNQVRKDIWSVSESQRFFLDQAFRMAIIDYLQNNIEGFSTFFITETPEGSLDIAYESQVAEMFWIFSNSNNKIIFTSNLNSSHFLKELFVHLNSNEKEKRILNLLRKGNMTKVQEKNSKRLEDIFQEIMEG